MPCEITVSSSDAKHVNNRRCQQSCSPNPVHYIDTLFHPVMTETWPKQKENNAWHIGGFGCPPLCLTVAVAVTSLANSMAEVSTSNPQPPCIMDLLCSSLCDTSGHWWWQWWYIRRLLRCTHFLGTHFLSAGTSYWHYTSIKNVVAFCISRRDHSWPYGIHRVCSKILACQLSIKNATWQVLMEILSIYFCAFHRVANSDL